MYAEQMVERIVSRLRQAQDFPDSGRRVPEFGRSDVRELFESPYRVIYRITNSNIEVVAVVHGRRELPPHLEG